MNRRRVLVLMAALITLSCIACSSGGGPDIDGEAGAERVDGATSADGGVEVADDDAENPVVFGYEVDGPDGTTAVVVATLVAQGDEQQPLTATWSITDRPRWQLFTNWIESGEVEVEVTDGGPATVRIIRGRPVDPDDPFAGIEVLEEIGTLEVAPDATRSISFP